MPWLCATLADAAMDSGGKKGTVFVTRNEERLEPQLKDVVVARTLPFIKMAPPVSILRRPCLGVKSGVQ